MSQVEQLEIRVRELEMVLRDLQGSLAVEYVAANIVFEALPGLSYGVEYLYGTRTDRNDAKGEAHRIQFSVRFNLP